MSILSIQGVRSYATDHSTNFDLSKYVTLIYGQNGSGKSTVSGYFYQPDHRKYRDCSVNPPLDMKYLVFNQEYIEETFHLSNTQPGIFTLSSENADIQAAIDLNEKNVSDRTIQREQNEAKLVDKIAMISTIKNECAKQIFDRSAEIRKSNLSSLMVGAKQRDSLYEKVINHQKSVETTTSELIKELDKLNMSKGNSLQTFSIGELPKIDYKELVLLSTPLIPIGDSQLSSAIQQLGNIDWVSQGKTYLTGDICPFCQSQVDGAHLRSEIEALFDASYSSSISLLNELSQRYGLWKNELNKIRIFLNDCELVDEHSSSHMQLVGLEQIYERNERKIANKLVSPSSDETPEDVTQHINLLLDTISSINEEIVENNRKAENFVQEQQNFTIKLFSHIKKISENEINSQNKQLHELQMEIDRLNIEITQLDIEISAFQKDSTEKTRSVSNIDTTILNINNMLVTLGITSFTITRCESGGEMYRLSRGRQENQDDDNIFRSLSEGEKTLIAFLYFLEKCRGKDRRDDIDTRDKLIVIDDPISSLSNNYIFEIASLIQHNIIKTKLAKKIIILTHNLFFFQEMILSSGVRASEDSPRNWGLLRISKNESSVVNSISRHDILNDYQALWYSLREAKESKNNTIIVPNTMRQILEYYFSFSCKNETLYRALDDLAKKHGVHGFNSFYRYINRNSHADGRNINHLEGISIDHYMQLFEDIFRRTDDYGHFEAMMGIKTQEEVKG
ncbi:MULTISPECIES: AAA family ATPase [Yersinia]|uniref:AAA family ATPase n=1 Tax=Yersinia TaxID=629 RepID=UPI00039ACC59|nr:MULTISPECIES: AAA family ATPase [Yersinia]EKN3529110.1 AAA family ATPase [Yersinia enterocolitica]KGA67151.1 AAA domain protein [Yersinia pseudotuberculosis]CND78780.1 Uncharacterized protein conserved in bacteria [Yersinia pseudotuberculosis]CNF51991.1 Uncharacterized protein conserved in bacteria [Yersinia enterocolitica]CQH21477.1 Uncharacterized protein conserved in bacteria [Yersinia pseudotuberculosis]